MSDNQQLTVNANTLPAVSEETRFMMDMISQIALNPDADVEKLRAVMDMKMQMFNRGAEIEFNAAMALAQAEIEPVARTAINTQTKSKYAKLENIITKCSPVWTKHGFALSYDTGDCPLERHYRVTCEVSHRAGHSKHYHMDLPIDDAGINGTKNKTGVHGAGSTISYGKRYIACNIFNIAIKDEDNDAQSASNFYVNANQAKAINSKLNLVSETAKSKFLEVYGSVETVPKDQFDLVMARLNASKPRDQNA